MLHIGLFWEETRQDTVLYASKPTILIVQNLGKQLQSLILIPEALRNTFTEAFNKITSEESYKDYKEIRREDFL